MSKRTQPVTASGGMTSGGTVLGQSARSNLWFYPGEILETGQMRVTLMGTGWGNVVSPVQKGPSIFVELGTDAQDSFVFDVGPGCILNYNAMEIPMSRMNHVFLSHLHMDHCSDLPFIYAFGPNLGDRFTPLNIYGPSGPELIPTADAHVPDDRQRPNLGVHNLVRGMKRFTQWHTTSFATMTVGADSSYELGGVRELDYRVCGGLAYKSETDTDRVRILHFPAVHIIDGAISYRLEWSRKIAGEWSKPIVLVYSGDTQPSEFMVEHGQNADLLIHETAPSINSIMNGAGASEEEANAIVYNSHTPATDLGMILSLTQPTLGVTTHTPVDPRSIDALITGVRQHYPDGAYQVGADLMVFNVIHDEDGESTVTTRMAAPIERPWPVRIEDSPEDEDPPLQDQLEQYRAAFTQKHTGDTTGSGDVAECEVNIFSQARYLPGEVPDDDE